LTPQEKEMVRRYTEDTTVNRYLRGLMTEEGAAWYKPRALPIIFSMNQALKKVHTTQDLTLWRGIQGGYVESVLHEGSTFQDLGFTSATLSQSVARRFTRRNGGGGQLMRLHLPRGSNALFVDSIPELALGQKEVILPKGRTFHVTGKGSDGVWDVEVS
jgi:hypothetical protein